MKRFVCLYYGDMVVGIWQCDNGDFYVHEVATDEEYPTEEKIWEGLDFAIAFHKGVGYSGELFDILVNQAELLTTEEVQRLQKWAKAKQKEFAEASVEGRTDK